MRSDRAALVEGDRRVVDPFKEVFEGNALAHSILVENHLKRRQGREQKQVFYLDRRRGAALTLLGLVALSAFSALST